MKARLSADNRFVVFESNANNLVPGDTNGHHDIFWLDRQTGEIRRVNVSASGQQSTSWAFGSSISGDGRFVAFVCESPLVPDDTNNAEDVYVYDSLTATLERVTRSYTGGQISLGTYCHHTALSGDGRFVAFQSTATNLVPGDTNYRQDIFVADRESGQIERINVAADGTQANDRSLYSWISDDGRHVSFHSMASNLVLDDTNFQFDVFLFDRTTRTLALVSKNTAGEQGNNGSLHARVSPDGQYVTYFSTASNLVPDDTNGVGDIFVASNPLWTPPAPTQLSGIIWNDLNGNRVRDPAEPGLGGWTVFLDLNDNGLFDDGEPSTISSLDGDHPVGFYSFVGLEPGVFAVRAVLPLLALQTSPSVAVREHAVHAVANLPYGRTDWYAPRLSADGRYAVFASEASLVPGDTNNASDIYLQDTVTGEVWLMSGPAGGGSANHGSWRPEISPDGRFVAFMSFASNMTPDTTDGFINLFIVDRETGVLECITADQPGDALAPRFSSDGRYVTYEYEFNDSIRLDPNAPTKDIVVFDRQTGQRKVATIGFDGNTTNSISWAPEIRGDGWYVVFMSRASNLVRGDNDSGWDVFCYDTVTESIECLSLTEAGLTANGSSERPSISADGRYVAFHSTATNLPGQTVSGGKNVFLWELASQQLTHVAGSGIPYPSCDALRPALSDDGRLLVYMTSRENIETGNFNVAEIYVYDRTTGRAECVSFDQAGQRSGDVNVYPFLSGDGNTITFLSNSEQLLSGVTPQIFDLFTVNNPMSVPWKPLGHRVALTQSQSIVGLDFGMEELPLVVSTSVDEVDGDYSTGSLSLREALWIAAQRAEAQVITFDEALAGQTIALSSLLGELDVAKSVSIVGPGRDTLTIDAQGLSRVLNLAGVGDVVLAGLSLTGGFAETGGAIRIHGGDLTLRDVAIRQCDALYGGAIHASGGAYVAVEGSLLANNVASASGGAIFAEGMETVVYISRSQGDIASQLLDNQAAVYGGAVFAVHEAEVHLVDTLINRLDRGDHAAHLGGAIATHRGGNVTLSRTTIAGMAANVGGGVYVGGESTLRIENNSFLQSNSAAVGAGLYVRRNGEATVTDSTFEQNTAVVRGGAVAVEGNGAFPTLTNVQMRDNRAAVLGGALYVASGATASLSGGTISGAGLKAAGIASAALGGGIGIERGGHVVAMDVHVVDHLASFGGGIFASGPSSATFNHSTIRANEAVRLGNQIMNTAPATVVADAATKAQTDQGHSGDLFGTIDWIAPSPNAISGLVRDGDEPEGGLDHPMPSTTAIFDLVDAALGGLD